MKRPQDQYPIASDEEALIDALIEMNVKRHEGKPHAHWKFAVLTGEVVALVYVTLGDNARRWHKILDRLENGETVIIYNKDRDN